VREAFERRQLWGQTREVFREVSGSGSDPEGFPLEKRSNVNTFGVRSGRCLVRATVEGRHMWGQFCEVLRERCGRTSTLSASEPGVFRKVFRDVCVVGGSQ
jgi:hypothetical protein